MKKNPKHLSKYKEKKEVFSKSLNTCVLPCVKGYSPN